MPQPQFDDDREWIQWYIEDEQHLDRLNRWWRENELLAQSTPANRANVVSRASHSLLDL